MSTNPVNSLCWHVTFLEKGEGMVFKTIRTYQSVVKQCAIKVNQPMMAFVKTSKVQFQTYHLEFIVK